MTTIHLPEGALDTDATGCLTTVTVSGGPLDGRELWLLDPERVDALVLMDRDAVTDTAMHSIKSSIPPGKVAKMLRHMAASLDLAEQADAAFGRQPTDEPLPIEEMT